MSETIEIRAGLRAAAAGPASASAGVVVVHEWHGLNDSVRAIVDRLGAEGFAALAPDLYHGEVATDDARAAELMNALETAKALEDIAAAVTHLRQRGCSKVGIIGFCMGGAMAFASAAAVDGLACAVPFYGIPVVRYWDATKLTRVPLQAHFSKTDQWAKPARAEEMARAVNAAGGHMELFLYDAPHAFMRAGDPAVHVPAAAAEAWTRSLAFLRTHLA